HSDAHSDPHPFPTRRSSDLKGSTLEVCTAIIGSNKAAWLIRYASNPNWKSAPGASNPHARPTVANSKRASSERNNICSPNLPWLDRKSTRLNSSHVKISYAV